MIRNCFKKCMVNQRLLKFGLCIIEKKCKVMLRKIFKDSKPEKAKFVITLKRRFFTNTSETFKSSGDETNFDESFQKLLKCLSGLDISQSVDVWFGVD